jgi:hypothetical protein
MRNKSVNYWLNQILSAERKSSNTIEPRNSKELNYQLAEYYVSRNNTNQTKVA